MTNLRKLSAGMMLASLAAVTAAGCSARNGISFDSLIGKKNRDHVPVAKIIAVWEASRGRDMNGSPSRGMAGQISFYTPGDPSPVPVDGTVLIYVFDNVGSKSEQAKPIHKFRFSSGAWNRHLRESQLGPTYHVFIPYTQKVVHQVEVAIAVRFLPDKPNAPQAASDLAPITLPGPRRKGEEETKLHIVSEQIPRKKVKVSTFNTGIPIDEVIHTAAKDRTTSSDSRNPSNFHNFDLNRQTQVKTVHTGDPRVPSDSRDRKYDQESRTLLGNRGTLQRTPQQTVADANSGGSVHAGHRDSLDRSPGFRLRMSDSASPRRDRGVQPAVYERNVDTSRGTSGRNHPFEDAEGPGRDHGRRDANDSEHRHPLTGGGNPNRPLSIHRTLDSDAAVDFSSPNSYRSRRSQPDHTPRPANVNHPLVDERGAWGND